MYLLLASHLLGRYIILAILPTLVEPLPIPLPEVVVYFLMSEEALDDLLALLPIEGAPGKEEKVAA